MSSHPVKEKKKKKTPCRVICYCSIVEEDLIIGMTETNTSQAHLHFICLIQTFCQHYIALFIIVIQPSHNFFFFFYHEAPLVVKSVYIILHFFFHIVPLCSPIILCQYSCYPMALFFLYILNI